MTSGTERLNARQTFIKLGENAPEGVARILLSVSERSGIVVLHIIKKEILVLRTMAIQPAYWQSVLYCGCGDRYCLCHR